MSLTRRIFLKFSIAGALILSTFSFLRSRSLSSQDKTDQFASRESSANGLPLGVDSDGNSRVYLVKNSSPEENIKQIIDMMGGIQQLIDVNDIVVLKPNAQWWNQGMTNTDAMKAFIELVLGIPGFSGEIIIAENHQFKKPNSRGWTTTERNGAFNFNELIQYFQDKGFNNVTKYHWQVAGRASTILEGDAQGNSRVTGPWEGDGYVWCEDQYYLAPSGKKCLMTNPIFTSSYSGVTVDLQQGAWKDGQYLQNTRVRFINFSALNHHGWYCGVTASVKNLMGVVDMTCGFPGDEPEGTYNTHHIGVSKLLALSRKKLLWRLTKFEQFKRYCYHDFQHTGGALGCFMKYVRLPDLNIITAERVGWGSRTDTSRSFQAKTILASRDPVALDYIAARDVLLPVTPELSADGKRSRYYRLNDPDDMEGPFYRFLAETARQGVGQLDQNKIVVKTLDVKA